jgi:hypothetical protein
MKNALSALIRSALVALLAPCAVAYNTGGVIDRAGRAVVPCEYHRVEYLANGFFFVEEMDPENPLKFSYIGRIVDHNGQLVSIKIPPNSTLSKVFLPDSAEGQDSHQDLPIGTIFEIHGPEGFGLCRLDGKIVLEPKFRAIGNPNKESTANSSIFCSQNTLS